MDTLTRQRPGMIALAGIGAVLVAGIAAVMILGNPDTIKYAAGTPEFTAQKYIQGLLDNDPDAAYALLTIQLQANCRPTELAIKTEPAGSAVFDRVQVHDNRATIDLRLIGTGIESGPFVIDQPEIEAMLILDKSSGEWRIADASWPLYDCAGKR